MPEVENLADKFLKSILGSDIFDSPSSTKSDSQGKVMSLSFMLWCTGHSRMSCMLNKLLYVVNMALKWLVIASRGYESKTWAPGFGG